MTQLRTLPLTVVGALWMTVVSAITITGWLILRPVWEEYRVIKALKEIRDTQGVTVTPDSSAFPVPPFDREFFRNKQEFRGRGGAVALGKVVNDDKQDAGIRNLATYVIYQIGPEAKAAVPLLIETLVDKEARVRSQAALALVGIGPYAVPALLSAINDRPDDRKWAINALGRIGPGAEAAIPTLLETLNDPDLDTCVFAMEGLGRLPNDPRSLPALIGELKHEEGYIRGWAAVILGRLGNAAIKAVPAITTVCYDADKFASTQAREGAIAPVARYSIRGDCRWQKKRPWPCCGPFCC